MKSLRLLCMLLFLLPAALHAQSRTYRVGDMTLLYDLSAGMTLTVHGVDVIRSSSFWVVEQDWSAQVYGLSMNPGTFNGATTQWGAEGDLTITIPLKLPDNQTQTFSGTQTIRMWPTNRIQVDVNFALLRSAPANLEWKIGGFTPTPIIGRPFTAQTSGGADSGTIFLDAPSSDFNQSMVASNFTQLQIDSRMGPITITQSGTPSLVFSDYRKNRWADVANPYFWFGRLGHTIRQNEQRHYSVTVTFPQDPSWETTTIPLQRASVEAPRNGRVRMPNHTPELLIPKAKQLIWQAGTMPLNSDFAIYVGEAPSQEILDAVNFLLEDLDYYYGLRPQVHETTAPDVTTGTVLLIGETARFAQPTQFCAAAGLAMPSSPEGYMIRVTQNRAAIAATTPTGAFYGVTSLLQMIGRNEKGPFLRAATVRDWPTLSFRGVHALTGKNRGAEIAQAVRDLLARYKMNTFVWQCEYLKWESHPEIHHSSYGMDKNDAQKVLDMASRTFIEIIPLLPALGHAEWVFANNSNLDIAEDTASRYALCPTCPRTYTFLADIFEEMQAFFKPRTVHLGHDEVTTAGTFPSRSASSGLTVTQLVMGHLDWARLWWKDRGIDSMIWGDMFLAPSQVSDAGHAPSVAVANERRALLDRSVIIADWHYVPADPEDFTSVPLWQGEGFSVVGSSWYTPDNIANLAIAMKDNNSLGLLQTTWAGFNFAINGNENAWYQYWAYILAAHYAWSGDETAPADLPWDAAEVFQRTWSREVPLRRTHYGYLVDLSPLANRKLADDTALSGWLGFGPTLDMRSLPTGEQLLGETRYLLQPNDDNEGAVLLAGRLNPPGELPGSVQLDLPKGVNAREVRFLMNTAFPASTGASIGTIKLTFADGTGSQMALSYGKNIFAFNDVRAGSGARLAWSGATTSGVRTGAWEITFNTPSAERELESITVLSTGAEAPILLGVTIVTGEAKGEGMVVF